MSGQQVTDEGTRLGQSHNGGSESKLNLTLLDRRRGERWKRNKVEESSDEENFTDSQTMQQEGYEQDKGVMNPVDVPFHNTHYHINPFSDVR